VSLPPTSICLTCRTALARGEPCDGGPRHRIVDLESVDGREAHLHAGIAQGTPQPSPSAARLAWRPASSPRAPANIVRIPVGVPVLKCIDSHRFD
jgi:hypothetical protein